MVDVRVEDGALVLPATGQRFLLDGEPPPGPYPARVTLRVVDHDDPTSPLAVAAEPLR